MGDGSSRCGTPSADYNQYQKSVQGLVVRASRHGLQNVDTEAWSSLVAGDNRQREGVP